MVSVTLSVPKEVKEKMEQFEEMNWSGFIRKCIVEKTRELSWKEKMMKKWGEEKEFNEWAVKVLRKGRGERVAELKKKGLL